jgi:hypothetical protein
MCIRVQDGSTATVIGGLTAGARNVFAGGAAWGIEVFGNGTRGTRIMGNYFGSNKPGTRRRSLANGVLVSLGAGTQTIGGANPDAGNHFTPSGALGTPRAVRIEGTGAVVQNNTFGTLANGGGVGGMSSAVALLDSTASILDNDIAHASDEGIRVDGAASNPRVFGNRFRDCSTAVRMDTGARCQLGNLGNTSATDNGGNVFRPSNVWFVYNNTANAVKAEGNSFSTNSRAAINAKVWDHRDNASLGRVDFDPLAGGVHPDGDAGSLQITNAAALAGRGRAEIVFSLSAPGEVSVHVLNVAGRLVATPLDGAPVLAGTQRVPWSRRTSLGLAAPPGAYIVRIRARGPDGQRSDTVCPLRLGP